MKRDVHIGDIIVSYGPVFKMIAEMESIDNTWIIGDIVILYLF